MTRVLVSGAAGFIGGHLCKHLKEKGYQVYGVDIELHPWHCDDNYDEFEILDCRKERLVHQLFYLYRPEHVYALAATMGGAGFVFTGEHDLEILLDNARINSATTGACQAYPPKRLLFTSSACIYPQHLQGHTNVPGLVEENAYPADPDSEYGWEKLFAERLYITLGKATSIQTRIARFHNIFGPQGAWTGGREKLPAAACRKIAEAKLFGGSEIKVWGDGEATRSFCYIDDCVEMIHRLMLSNCSIPMNIGTDHLVSVNKVFDIVAEIAGVEIAKEHDLSKPQGVRGRNADLTLMRETLDYEPQVSLKEGLRMTYEWIEEQIREYS